jgi:single-stranded-DNA-specific exonuclease
VNEWRGQKSLQLRLKDIGWGGIEPSAS